MQLQDRRMWSVVPPQGSALGPILFSLYIVNNLEDTTIEMYANDTTLYCISNSIDTTFTSLNHALDLCAKWCNTNEMTIHPAKCEAMIMTNTHFVGPLPQLTINGNMVKLVNATRCLSWMINLTGQNILYMW